MSRRVGPGGLRAGVTKPLGPTGDGTWPRCRPEADDVIAHVGTQAFKDFVERAPDLVAAQPQIIYVDAPDVPGWGPMGEIQPRS